MSSGFVLHAAARSVEAFSHCGRTVPWEAAEPRAVQAGLSEDRATEGGDRMMIYPGSCSSRVPYDSQRLEPVPFYSSVRVIPPK